MYNQPVASTPRRVSSLVALPLIPIGKKETAQAKSWVVSEQMQANSSKGKGKAVEEQVEDIPKAERVEKPKPQPKFSSWAQLAGRMSGSSKVIDLHPETRIASKLPILH